MATISGALKSARPLQTTDTVPERSAPRARPSTRSLAAGWYRRIPWIAIAISVAVVLSSAFAVQPVRDAVSGADVPEAYLVRPPGYVAIAPVSSVLDTISLVSVRQHVAMLIGLLAILVLWRVGRALIVGSGWRRHLVSLAVVVVSVLTTYAAAALLPRPMAFLEADDANIVRVDFHSHTSASHDGRLTAEQNREWHRRAGFNVAYVTDHGSVAGAERGVAANPRPAGEGVTLLQAIEVTWTGEHVAILGAQRTYTGLLTANLRDVDVEGLRLGSVIPGREPVVIWNHPREPNRLQLASGPGTAGVRAIEIVNGAPNDMDVVRANKSRLLAMAQRADVALTAGTDNHGWGRAAPGWTLLRVPGWRGMQSDALAAQIEQVLRGGGYDATRVVERRVADANTILAASIVTVPARMLTTLSNEERVAWLIWTWLVTAALWWFRRTRQRS